MSDDKRTIQLTEPIKHGKEETLTELTFMKPRAKHIRNFSENANVGIILDLAAKLCGVTPRTFGELCMEDTGKVMGVMEDFLSPIQGIGLDFSQD